MTPRRRRINYVASVMAVVFTINAVSIFTLQHWSIEEIRFQQQQQDPSPRLHHNHHPVSSSASSSLFSQPSDIDQDQTHQLPQWIENYFRWHDAMRLQYPGTSLLTHPDSPGVLIKVCNHQCGGLHDRFGGLGWDLYLANQTRRILLIHWCNPAPIENYLVPNLVDWRLPRGNISNPSLASASPTPSSSSSSSSSSSEPTSSTSSEGEVEEYVLDERLFPNITQNHIKCSEAVQNWPGLFDGYREQRPGTDFWESQIDIALDRAKNGEYSNRKILRVKILGFDEFLEKRLRERHGETDAIGWTGSFSTIFWRMFRLSVGLQQELNAAFVDLGLLLPGRFPASSSLNESDLTLMMEAPPLPPFYAIHVRIRHPRGHVEQTMEGNPDKNGLKWEDGPTKQFAISVAEHSFRCAQERGQLTAKADRSRTKRRGGEEVVTAPIFIFFADSEDLVTHMGREYQNDGLRVRNTMGRKVVHIDRQQEMSPESYYDSFVDLFVAEQASCVILLIIV
jgi:hypothetical protein